MYADIMENYNTQKYTSSLEALADRRDGILWMRDNQQEGRRISWGRGGGGMGGSHVSKSFSSHLEHF